MQKNAKFMELVETTHRGQLTTKYTWCSQISAPDLNQFLNGIVSKSNSYKLYTEDIYLIHINLGVLVKIVKKVFV